MKCPYCAGTESQVMDSRETGNDIRRRRQCGKCNKRFTTYERVETFNLIVIKKDQTREQYDRNKVRNGILKACEKRPITADQINKVVDDIEKKLKNSKSTEIKSTRIGELVMNRLRALDKVAYIRFASVYRSFTDLESFEQELRNLVNKKSQPQQSCGVFFKPRTVFANTAAEQQGIKPSSSNKGSKKPQA